VIGNANTTYYTIAGQTTSEWEVGIGTYTSAGTLLARTTVLSNSSATEPSALNFAAGTKDVFVTYPSGKSVNLDASGNATALGTPASFVGTNITGTASGLTAGNVTTNANLTGDVTSVGNATSIAAGVIVDADINASAAIVDTKLATISTALKVSNSATTATNANTASAIVARDASGNFSAGTITASLTGNASTVTTNANLTGDVTSVGNATSIAAGVIVNADINASAGIVDTKLATISTASKVSNSATTATNANTASAIVARDASGNFSAGTITATLTGTATGLAGTPNITVGTIASGNLTVTGAITATGNITAFFSDDRLKTRIGNIPDALAKVQTLNGFHYHANETAVALGYEVIPEIGVSAQEVQKILPEVVAPAPIDEKYLTVRYERLVPLLIEAIKELNAKVTALEQVVAKSTQG